MSVNGGPLDGPGDEAEETLFSIDELGDKIDRAYERLGQLTAIVDRTAEIAQRTAERAERAGAILDRFEPFLTALEGSPLIATLEDPPPQLRALADVASRRSAKRAAKLERKAAEG